MESCNGKIKDEYLDQLTVTKNYNELKNVVKKIINLWNRERIHSGLKGQSPDEFIHNYFEFKKNK
jgi:transposase InsO family protein